MSLPVSSAETAADEISKVPMKSGVFALFAASETRCLRINSAIGERHILP